MEDVSDYIEKWRNPKKGSLYNQMLDGGFIRLACKLLVDTGVVNSKTCLESDRPIEQKIERI